MNAAVLLCENVFSLQAPPLSNNKHLLQQLVMHGPTQTMEILYFCGGNTAVSQSCFNFNLVSIVTNYLTATIDDTEVITWKKSRIVQMQVTS